MQYLVQMRLTNTSRPTTADEGLIFIEQYILPTLERCEELQSHDKITAGGPVSGAVALDLIVNEVITSLQVWPLSGSRAAVMTRLAHERCTSDNCRLDAPHEVGSLGPKADLFR
jgi:hypothetical protein